MPPCSACPATGAVHNLLGFRSPYDFGTYGGYPYNPAWSQNGIVQHNVQFGVTGTF